MLFDSRDKKHVLPLHKTSNVWESTEIQNLCIFLKRLTRSLKLPIYAYSDMIRFQRKTLSFIIPSKTCLPLTKFQLVLQPSILTKRQRQVSNISSLYKPNYWLQYKPTIFFSHTQLEYNTNQTNGHVIKPLYLYLFILLYTVI